MKKCKNIECGIEIPENRTYCSFGCRNIYVNKHLRDYNKISKALSKEKKYYENPKKCNVCGKIIEYKKRNNNFFCSQSCSVSYTNTKRKGSKYNITEQRMEQLKESANVNFLNKRSLFISEEKKQYLKNPRNCIECNKILEFKKRKNKFCSKNCRGVSSKRNMTYYNLYKKECNFNFNLNDFYEEFDFNLIEKHGWYKAKNNGNNLNGVSRDHMYSINEGFKKKISTKLISHPANCKLMIHNENSSKSNKCSITLEELKNRIILWDLKYGKFYKDLIMGV
jgi:predicted nucleic acid-binding Zn ribbon protein